MSKPQYSAVFLMGFEVAQNPDTESGYGFASADAKGRRDLLGDIRLVAAAALYNNNCVERIITTGMVQIPPPHLNSAEVIREMLVDDFDIPREAVDVLAEDGKNTGGAVFQIKECIRVCGLSPRECVVLTNHYHYPRTREMLDAAELRLLPVRAAEAVLIGLNSKFKGPFSDDAVNWVNRRLRECDLANLLMKEFQGLAALWAGTYQS